MGLKAILESVDDLPEGVKEYYTEANGKFVLDIDGIDDHPKVRGVVTANKENARKRDEAKAERDALKARLDGLPEDFDADAYEHLKSAADGKGGQMTAEQQAELTNKIKDKLEKQYKPLLDEKDASNQKFMSALQRMTIDDGLSKAMDEASIDPRHKSKLIPYLKANGAIKVEEADGNFSAVVETDLGPTTLSKFVSEWASSDDGKIYVAQSTGPNPKGGGKGGAGGKTMKRAQFDALDPSAKSETISSGIEVVD